MRVPSAAVLAFLVIQSCDPFLTSNGSVDEGNERYQAGEFEEAQAAYENAREELPERPELHYNLGTTLLARDQFEEAETALTRALENAPPGFKPSVLANLGLTRLRRALAEEDETARKEALARALSALERAVELDPSLEAARKNLEITLLHLYPPCHLRDDEFEPNDSADKASPAAETADKQLLLCPGNRDYFNIELKARDRLNVRVQGPGGTGGDDGATSGTPAPELEVLDPSGAIVAHGENDEGRSRSVLYESRQDGSFLVHVFENDGEEHPYSLSAEVLPACDTLQDEFEPNETVAEAPIIGFEPPEGEQPPPGQGQPPGKGGQTSLRICPGDHDWFQLRLENEESLLVQVSFEPVSGKVAMELTDAEGKVLATGVESKGQAQAQGQQGGGGPTLMASVLDVRAPTSVFVHVYGDSKNAEAAVTLTAMIKPPCPEGDDEMEENDSRQAARDLAPAAPPGAAPPAAAPGQQAPEQAQPIQHLLRRCAGDDDWFKLQLKKGESRQVQIGFEHAKGDLRLEAYKEGEDAPAVVSDKSSPEQAGEGVALQAAEDTVFELRITGADNVANFYQLTIQPPSEGDGDKDKNQDDQEEEKQNEKQPEQKKPIEQMMDQLDKQKRPNIEAQKALNNAPHVRSPGGKVW